VNLLVLVVGLLVALASGVSAVVDTATKLRALRTPATSSGSLVVPGGAATPRSRLRWFARPIFLGLVTVVLLAGTFTLGRTTAPQAHPRPRYADGTRSLTGNSGQVNDRRR
jgi:hypothetical protein